MNDFSSIAPTYRQSSSAQRAASGLVFDLLAIGPCDDVLDLGDVTEPTGCEDHNGHNLLKRAGFEPVSVTYVPRSSALVELLG